MGDIERRLRIAHEHEPKYDPDSTLLLEAAARIAELESQAQWVSVKERLPDEGERVLIWHKQWSAEAVRWESDRTAIGLCGDKPTHWKPIHPPEGEG